MDEQNEEGSKDLHLKFVKSPESETWKALASSIQEVQKWLVKKCHRRVGKKLSKIVLLMLGLTVRVLGPIVTEMKTQSLAHCTFILKENA